MKIILKTKLKIALINVVDLDLLNRIDKKFSYKVPNSQFMPTVKAKMWDGYIHLFNKWSGELPLGLLKELLNYLRTNNYKFDIHESLLNFLTIDKDIIENISKEKIIDYCNSIGLLKPYQHQIDFVYDIFKYKRLIGLSATGSGKSYISFLFFLLYQSFKKNHRILMIVPTSHLVGQMKTDFYEYIDKSKMDDDYKTKLKNSIITFRGSKNFQVYNKSDNTNITITTWQTLQNIKNKSFFEQFNSIINDEVHLTAQDGQSTKKIREIIEKCINSVFRIGMTGTLDFSSELTEKSLKGLFGDVIVYLSMLDSMKKGITTKLNIQNLLFEYREEIKKDFWKKIKTVEPGTPNAGVKIYNNEINYINKLEKRNFKIIEITEHLVNKEKQNVLIIFKTLKFGKHIYEQLKKLLGEDKVYYVAGEVKANDRNDIRKQVENHVDGSVIVASAKTFSTGVNIKRLHSMIFAQSTKSKYTVIQSIGRLLRKHGTKENVLLYDIIDNFKMNKKSSKNNFSMEHFKTRLNHYDNEGLKYKTKKVFIK